MCIREQRAQQKASRGAEALSQRGETEREIKQRTFVVERAPMFNHITRRPSPL